MKPNFDPIKPGPTPLRQPEDKQAQQGEALEKMKKEISRLTYRLERAVKEKQTLSTLLTRTSEDLEKSSEIIKKMFGRYLSTEVMNSLLEDPSGLELGGEKRTVTIMITDLRGFSELSERLSPEQVVQMLNVYFEVMVDIIFKYHGTINEIIGDALLVIFGAPQSMKDRTHRAVACAIEMQNAMSKVNDTNRNEMLPDLEMGIGINETEVIVGNIGSDKRSKYAVVGSGVNLTSRIESYSVGGQVLISESVRQKIGHLLHIEAQQNVSTKGVEGHMHIYEVSGIAGHYNLTLEVKKQEPLLLSKQVPFSYMVLEGKNVGAEKFTGRVVRLSSHCAEVSMKASVPVMTNVQMELEGVDQRLSSKTFHGKVIKTGQRGETTHMIRFTSVPPEVDAFFQAHLQHALKP